jgi:hypothetical protein
MQVAMAASKGAWLKSAGMALAGEFALISDHFNMPDRRAGLC